MAAPTRSRVLTPLTTINYSILSKLKLTPTPLGMRTFMIKFPAAIGPLLATSLRNAITHEQLDPESDAQAAIFTYIYDALVGCMTDDSSADLLAMTKDCGNNGPKCVVWLQRKIDPSTTASRHRHPSRPRSEEGPQRHPA